MYKEGSWVLSSKSDWRWNASGRGFVGGFEICSEAKKWIDEKKKELDEEPPDDLMFRCIKD